MLHVSRNPWGCFMPDNEARPVASLNQSPLKRKTTAQIGQGATFKGELYPRKKQKVHESVIIAERADNLNDFMQMTPLQAQVGLIEHSLRKSSLTAEQRLPIQNKIVQVLDNLQLSNESKLVELGILHYYCASGKPIPPNLEPSLFTMRLEALLLEIDELKKAHQSNLERDPDQFIASGVTAYLLRTFVRTIFPHDGGINLGGCYVIKTLLNSRLNLFLTEEMRAQVLSVIGCLLNDSEFLKLFLDPFEPHPSMKVLICLDLKIPFSEEINFVYVRWSMLTALFSSIGQIREGNCYAVAMALNLLSMGKQGLVKLMIEILQTGHFLFERKKIPILPLLETRRQYTFDFNVKMTQSQARALTAYEVAHFVLNPPPTASTDSEVVQRPLGEWLELAFGEHVKIAKELFLSHKVSFLQQALLATIQFVSLNSCDEIEQRLGARFQILDEMMKDIHVSLMKRLAYPAIVNHPGNQILNREFLQHLRDQIFVVDYTHSDINVVGDKVVFDFHSQGFVFNGQLENYQPFKATRRLFRLKEGEFRPIDKLSEFVQCCVASLVAVSSSEYQSVVKLGQRILKQHLESPKFRESIARQIATHNKPRSQFDWVFYEASDSCFFIQRGGKNGLIAGFNILEGQFAKI